MIQTGKMKKIIVSGQSVVMSHDAVITLPVLYMVQKWHILKDKTQKKNIPDLHCAAAGCAKAMGFIKSLISSVLF